MNFWRFILWGVWRKEQKQTDSSSLSQNHWRLHKSWGRAHHQWWKTGAAGCPRSWNLLGSAQVGMEWVLVSVGILPCVDEGWLEGRAGEVLGVAEHTALSDPIF